MFHPVQEQGGVKQGSTEGKGVKGCRNYEDAIKTKKTRC
jgi:hypothetical protein